MKNTIFVIGAMIIALAGIVWMAQPSPQGGTKANLSASKGILTVTENGKYDFGTIPMSAGKVSHTFKIKNDGAEAINLGKLYTSCMCTTAKLKMDSKQFGPFGMMGHGMIPKINQMLEPGREADIEVIFDPAAHGPAGVGAIARVVTMESNANNLEINFKAMVTP